MRRLSKPLPKQTFAPKKEQKQPLQNWRRQSQRNKQLSLQLKQRGKKRALN